MRMYPVRVCEYCPRGTRLKIVEHTNTNNAMDSMAGADLPEQYKSTMRLDVGIPSTMKEAEMKLTCSVKLFLYD
ncbi:hypothetical protein Ahy_A03g015631 [Arachis hypogaea]|uniref:Uncharacterized protein n=1 Tax=Arachis hypogaea TaxID=3818 RepID=A0A445E133_ARAHY|nr:hypothetical protein Ahy_A03g015631 [Arachis hypogaea]